MCVTIKYSNYLCVCVQLVLTMCVFTALFSVVQIYEYALGLGKHEGTLVHFQTLKLLHAFRLVEAGIIDKVIVHHSFSELHITSVSLL